MLHARPVSSEGKTMIEMDGGSSENVQSGTGRKCEVKRPNTVLCAKTGHSYQAANGVPTKCTEGFQNSLPAKKPQENGGSRKK